MLSSEDLIKYIHEIDWEFTDADTQYLTHNIHRYSGKFIPQIAGAAIQLLTAPGETVFDPYLGSGTTALEAITSGRNCIGVDINPLAILISRVKTTAIDKQILYAFQKDLHASIDAAVNDQLTLIEPKYVRKLGEIEHNKRYSDPWNKKWYQEHVLRQLIQIYEIIESVDDLHLRRIAQVSFSDILRRSSNANSRYPNVMYDKNAKEKPLPMRAFLESFNANIERLALFSDAIKENTPGSCRILHENNTALSLATCSVDAIITHPPYIAAVPYAEYGCLSLEWFGYSSKALDSELTGGKRHRKDVVDRFIHDYNLMFAESYRVLKHGGFAFYMVGNPTANGTVVDLLDKTIMYATKQGFHHLCNTTRRGINRRGNKMGEEYLVFFEKK